MREISTSVMDQTTGRIYVIGGSATDAQKSVEYFDTKPNQQPNPSYNTWTQMPQTLKQSRYGSTSVMDKNTGIIYVMGSIVTDAQKSVEHLGLSSLIAKISLPGSTTPVSTLDQSVTQLQ